MITSIELTANQPRVLFLRAHVVDIPRST